MTKAQRQRIRRHAAVTIANQAGPRLTIKRWPSVRHGGERCDVGEGNRAQPTRDCGRPSGTQRGFARRATHIQIGSVQCRFFFVFGISVRCTMILERLSLAIHLVKNTLAGQFGFASALAEPNPCMFFE
jgi:hypothetical protein